MKIKNGGRWFLASAGLIGIALGSFSFSVQAQQEKTVNPAPQSIQPIIGLIDEDSNLHKPIKATAAFLDLRISQYGAENALRLFHLEETNAKGWSLDQIFPGEDTRFARAKSIAAGLVFHHDIFEKNRASLSEILMRYNPIGSIEALDTIGNIGRKFKEIASEKPETAGKWLETLQRAIDLRDAKTVEALGSRIGQPFDNAAGAPEVVVNDPEPAASEVPEARQPISPYDLMMQMNSARTCLNMPQFCGDRSQEQALADFKSAALEAEKSLKIQYATDPAKLQVIVARFAQLNELLAQLTEATSDKKQSLLADIDAVTEAAHKEIFSRSGK